MSCFEQSPEKVEASLRPTFEKSSFSSPFATFGIGMITWPSVWISSKTFAF